MTTEQIDWLDDERAGRHLPSEQLATEVLSRDKAASLYPFDGNDPSTIIALRSAYRAGADWASEGSRLTGDTSLPLEGVRVATPGEFAAVWNSKTEAERANAMARFMESQDMSMRCIVEDHDALKDQLGKAQATLHKVLDYAEERHRHASARSNTLSSWRVWSDLLHILGQPVANSWTVEYAHQDCAECEDLAEQAIAYAQRAGTRSTQKLLGPGGHFGSAKKA